MVLPFLIPTWYDHVDNMLMPITWFFFTASPLILATKTYITGWWFGTCFIFPYTIWLFNIAMENCQFIDGLPIKNGDFPWLC